ncbi:MAG: hypothetical protein E7358_02435 [Clostridiales bacterium]|nr:hypothetical protein [Clostridiales bacterium]
MAGIPVITVRGILESGKTYFIIDSLTRGDFGDLGKVLILTQEEGVEEYKSEELSPLDIYVEYVEKENWKDKVINDLVRKHKPHVIFIERNETWDKNKYLYPEYFDVQQEILIIDGSSFKEYFSAMRQMMVDMVKECELVIINRCDYSENTSNIKKSLKMVNPNLEIIALDSLGSQIKLATDLPYDVSSEELHLKLSDFGDFYVDSFEQIERYRNKIIEFECMALFADELPPSTFFAARPALTCCMDDIQTIGHLCALNQGDSVENQTWIKLRARIHYIKINGTQGEQVLLEYLSSEQLPLPPLDSQLVKLV